MAICLRSSNKNNCLSYNINVKMFANLAKTQRLIGTYHREWVIYEVPTLSRDCGPGNGIGASCELATQPSCNTIALRFTRARMCADDHC